jgi:hypothetical protein
VWRRAGRKVIPQIFRTFVPFEIRSSDEVPNSKEQIPNKSQSAISKFPNASFGPLVVGIWSLFAIWILEFGYCDFLRRLNF